MNQSENQFQHTQNAPFSTTSRYKEALSISSFKQLLPFIALVISFVCLIVLTSTEGNVYAKELFVGSFIVCGLLFLRSNNEYLKRQEGSNRTTTSIHPAAIASEKSTYNFDLINEELSPSEFNALSKHLINAYIQYVRVKHLSDWEGNHNTNTQTMKEKIEVLEQKKKEAAQFAREMKSDHSQLFIEGSLKIQS